VSYSSSSYSGYSGYPGCIGWPGWPGCTGGTGWGAIFGLLVGLFGPVGWVGSFKRACL
jgi:hypothetical protein